MPITKEKKQVLFSITHPYFIKNGYKYLSDLPGTYRKFHLNMVIEMLFDFKNQSDDHVNTLILIHFKEVEKIILEVGLPNYNLSSYYLGEVFFPTILDNLNNVTFYQKKSRLDLSTILGVKKWGELIVSYMEKEGQSFIKEYSYLPNVLKEMNRLEREGEQNYLKILRGGIDHIFRGLIISRLCNDSDYEKKLKKWESLILIPKYEEWHSYFEKLKKILSETKSIY